MASQSTWDAHPHLAWAMWGLDGIEATLALFERNTHKLQADVRTKAESAMVDMRTARDAFRKSIEEHGQLNEVAFVRSKADLESQWATFEDSVQTYLESVGKQLAEQDTVFRARTEAQSKARQQAIHKLHKSTMGFAADRRGDIEAAVKRLESQTDASKVKLDQLNEAEGASWAAMKSARRRRAPP